MKAHCYPNQQGDLTLCPPPPPLEILFARSVNGRDMSCMQRYPSQQSHCSACVLSMHASCTGARGGECKGEAEKDGGGCGKGETHRSKQSLQGRRMMPLPCIWFVRGCLGSCSLSALALSILVPRGKHHWSHGSSVALFDRDGACSF